MSHGDLLGEEIEARGAWLADQHGKRGYTWARREVSYAAARAARLAYCTCGAIVTTFIHRNGEVVPVDCGRCAWRKRIEINADTSRPVAAQLAIDAAHKFSREYPTNPIMHALMRELQGSDDATES